MAEVLSLIPDTIKQPSYHLIIFYEQERLQRKLLSTNELGDPSLIYTSTAFE